VSIVLIETNFLEGLLPKILEMVYIAIINEQEKDGLISTINHRRRK
jgi:hypothetical protein